MQMIEKAQRPSHDQIVTFDEIRSQIDMEVTDPIQSAGIQSMWLPSLNTVLKVSERTRDQRDKERGGKERGDLNWY